VPPAGSAAHASGAAAAAPSTHAGCAFSAEAQRLARAAIADTTAATYATFIARYKQWCEEQGIDSAPATVSAFSIANFIAAVQQQYCDDPPTLFLFPFLFSHYDHYHAHKMALSHCILITICLVHGISCSSASRRGFSSFASLAYVLGSTLCFLCAAEGQLPLPSPCAHHTHLSAG
jgi:hypothetical protein